jgi:hypothetical protein
MISSIVSRVSAVLLAVCGATLLFAADVLLPIFIPDFPARGAWLGQLLGAAWLGVAALNWLQRGAVLGGIYGRPIVLANLALYFIGGLALLRALLDGGVSQVLWLATAPALTLAAVYGALLFAGPFDPLQRRAN